MSFMQFLAMHGFAAYVWPAYGLSLLGFVGLLITGYRAHKAAIKQVRRYHEEKA